MSSAAALPPVPDRRPNQPAAASDGRLGPYAGLYQYAKNLFDPPRLCKLVPPLCGRLRGRGESRGSSNGNGHSTWRSDPFAATEAIALDFLCRGGKYARPFITLAVYDSLVRRTPVDAAATVPQCEFTDAVKRIAISVEAFHKASLIHDDIEDDDAHRYGQPTVHCEYGVPTAINVGDYLIGLGYRLASEDTDVLGADVVADLVRCMSDAHRRLTEGQGAELFWREAAHGQLSYDEVLEIYALKTAPAFEAALFCGMRLAGCRSEAGRLARQFARELGTGFQILNDLKDWRGDRDNKLVAGGDVVGRRPTLLSALALKELTPTQRGELLKLFSNERVSAPVKIEEARRFYVGAGVFRLADEMVQACRQRAAAIAREAPGPLAPVLDLLGTLVLQPAATPVDG